MTRHTLSLANGWTAEFVEQGEFRMGAVGWNLQLHGPEQQTIGYFKTQIVLVNDEDGERARKAISLSEKSISLSEQPAYKRVREYIRVIGWFIYLTFPLTRDEDFPKVWEEYLVIRRRQLDELYFRN
ncbi:hypothetical protein AO265_39755 [Pseudomonas sp. ABAC61]|nr:hypothetical protein AO265_39755 [Pseudomonas sp. ABAC61]